MKESQIQTAILKWLKNQEGYWVKISDRFAKGYPDIWGCFRGKLITIEVKTPEEKPKPIQLYIMKSIKKEGGISIWVTSLEEVKKNYKLWNENIL